MHKILPDLDDDAVRALAATPTPFAQGDWTLLSPDGKTYTASTPTTALMEASAERIPPQVALARLRLSFQEPPTHTVTEHDLAKAFEAWENGYRTQPTEYRTAEECAALGVSELSSERAVYFAKLLDELSGG